ncbi:MAG: LolA family protein [Hyphomicrobium sp.]
MTLKFRFATWLAAACWSTALAGGASAQQPPAAAAATAPATAASPPTAAATPPSEQKPPAASAPATAKPPVDGWAGEVAPANSGTGLELDPAQTEAVKTVSGYFSDLQNLKGEFVQTGADKKRMKGKFFVKRPGRFRFDYALPSRQIIVSDGQSLAIQDLDLNNEDRVELDQTPFRLLLRKDVDLLRDARITEVQQAEDLIVVGLQDKSPDTPGRIRLYLSKKPALALKEWVTTDAQGLDTRIEVSDLVKVEDLDANLFKIQQLGAHRSTPQ